MREHEQGEDQREREKQTPRWAGSPTRLHPRTPGPSGQMMLHWLSHRGVPQPSTLNHCFYFIVYKHNVVENGQCDTVMLHLYLIVRSLTGVWCGVEFCHFMLPSTRGFFCCGALTELTYEKKEKRISLDKVGIDTQSLDIPQTIKKFR